MSKAEWDEVLRLAADFHRAQLTESSLKLSERNCVEIIQNLRHESLVDVIYTCDGKEFLTPSHLVTEIRNELAYQGGRLSLAELQHSLNVDITHIEASLEQVCGDGVTNILGQLINQDYLDEVSSQVFHSVWTSGFISVSELSKQFNLPSEFLLPSLLKRDVSSSVRVDDAGAILYTEEFVSREESRLLGAFSALLRPTGVATVLNEHNLHRQLCASLLAGLIDRGLLRGSVSPGGVYIPDRFAATQNRWVRDFIAQNGFIEFRTLKRIGVVDPKVYLRKQVGDVGLLELVDSAVCDSWVERVGALCSAGLEGDVLVDVGEDLPVGLSDCDAAMLVERGLVGAHPIAQVVGGTFLLPRTLVEQLKRKFDSIMNSRAKELVDSGALMRGVGPATVGGGGRKERKDERRKAAAGVGKAGGNTSGKSGGNTSGAREARTKGVDKKRRVRKADVDVGGEERGISSVEEKGGFLSVEEVSRVISEFLPPDCVVVDDVSEVLLEELEKEFQNVVAATAEAVHSAGGMSSVARKRMHAETQTRVLDLWLHAQLYRRAILGAGPDLKPHLEKHLSKTILTDLLNQLVALQFSAAGGAANDSEPRLTSPESRLKLIQSLPPEVGRDHLIELHKALGKPFEEFSNLLDEVAFNVSHIDVKNLDKRSEKSLAAQHWATLSRQLSEVTDPALALHIAVSLLYQRELGAPVHAPGRCVPALLAAVRPHLVAKRPTDTDPPGVVIGALDAAHNLVSETLRGVAMDTTESTRVVDELKAAVHSILSSSTAT